MATLGVRIFPTYGFNSARTDSGLECQCLKGKRWKARQTGAEATPCAKNPGKHPRILDWPELATTDADTIINWTLPGRGGWARTNLSALTGRASGVWVLDLDGDLGFASLAQLEAEHGALPPTWRTRSGSGHGRHYWFAHPNDGPEVRGSQGGMAAGVDVRGFHGHILLPGSLHRSGGRYQWEEGFAPDEVPLAAAPEAWLRLALDANKKTRTGDADDRPTTTRRMSPPTTGRPSDHTRCLVIGDGENRGGFHGPINGLLVKFFGRFGGDADTNGMIAALRQAIRDAPADNHQPHEIERYLSDEYLNEACDSARAYINSKD
ncbi:bifunctional DNA primase/polymerase [Brevundimonas sp. TWP2-3-4b1]|uniref:bifunctional DNA primase/polymerase n=1 Tax=Brevundimonas sp. TWP2-3-4b1 TaxID=2804580 RepID=UPI003CE81040